jgi:hypothetical protein
MACRYKCTNPRKEVIISKEDVYACLSEINANYLLFAYYLLVQNVDCGQGMFKGASRKSISLTDEIKGAAFHFIIMEYLIEGVEQNFFQVPGLSNVVSSGQMKSELQCAKEWSSERTQLLKGFVHYVDPADHFYKDIDAFPIEMSEEINDETELHPAFKKQRGGSSDE